MLCEELIDDFGEQLVSHQRGVVVVTDYDTGDALSATVGMECVIFLSSY